MFFYTKIYNYIAFIKNYGILKICDLKGGKLDAKYEECKKAH